MKLVVDINNLGRQISSKSPVAPKNRRLCKNYNVVNEVYNSFLEAAKTGKLHKQEIPTRLALETEQWTPDSGLVTDALKLKRTVKTKIIDTFYYTLFRY